jgi:hypothetical protein
MHIIIDLHASQTTAAARQGVKLHTGYRVSTDRQVLRLRAVAPSGLWSAHAEVMRQVHGWILVKEQCGLR